VRPPRPERRLRTHHVAGTLLGVAALAMAVAVLIIDRVGEAVIADRQREVAEAARDYFVAFAHEEGLASLGKALDLRERAQGREGFRYALYDNDGALVGGVNLLPKTALPGAGMSEMTIPADGRETPFHVLVQPIATGGTLVVFEDLDERASFRMALIGGSAAALALALAAVIATGVWLNRLILRRAEHIARTASQVADGRLSARAPSQPDGDVFDQLGAAINVMLDRNEDLMTGLRTVTDSLAHDLRTPLTRMRGALTRALDDRATEAARRDAIGEAWEEADGALATTSALLDIARAETGLSRDMFQSVDVGALIAEVAELFEPTLEDAGQSLSVDLGDAPVTLQAHELLLRQALGNLLVNASRYAGSGAEVKVTLTDLGDAVRIVVSDTGPGVPEADRGRVVERFVRLDPARTSHGSGLGLAIAAACAKLHGGALTLEDNRPGLRVVIDLRR